MPEPAEQQNPAGPTSLPDAAQTSAPIVTERGPVLLRQKLALVVFTLTVPILAMDYWQNGGRITFFGAIPLSTLAVIACVGGAVSFLMYGSARELVWAWIPGAIAGFGGFYSHILYTTIFEKEELWNMESIMVAAVGSLPGILIYWGVSKIMRPRSEKAGA